MIFRREELFNTSSTLVAWSALGLVASCLLISQNLKKTTVVPAPSASSPAPISRFMIEQLPVREEIQPEIIPEPKPEPKLEPELKPVLEPEKVAIEEPPPPEEPKEEPPHKVEPIPEPEAVPQKASTVEGGGTPVPPSLIHELQKMVEKVKYYPSRARRANITGVAILRLTITSSGLIQKAEPLFADHPYLIIGAKRTGARLLKKSVLSPPSHTIEVEIPLRYELR